MAFPRTEFGRPRPRCRKTGATGGAGDHNWPAPVVRMVFATVPSALTFRRTEFRGGYAPKLFPAALAHPFANGPLAMFPSSVFGPRPIRERTSRRTVPAVVPSLSKIDSTALGTCAFPCAERGGSPPSSGPLPRRPNCRRAEQFFGHDRGDDRHKNGHNQYRCHHLRPFNRTM